MSLTNKDLLALSHMIKGGMIDLTDIATYGKLNPEQSKVFLDWVYNEAVMKNHARQVQVTAEKMYIEKIGIGERVAMSKIMAQDPTYRRGVTTSRVELYPKEIMVPWETEDTFKLLNVEGESIGNHIMRMFADKLANNMEEANWLGNSHGAAVLQSSIIDGGDTTRYIKDDFLALGDGWLQQIMEGTGSHLKNFANASVSTSLFSSLIQEMPSKYRRDLTKLRFYVSSDYEQIIREKIASRSTPAGDAALVGQNSLMLYGIPVVPIPLLPSDATYVEHVVLNGTTARQLLFAPISDVVVTVSTLGLIPTNKLTITTDYITDLTNGTITRVGGGAIGDGDTVKVTYKIHPVIILTPQYNLIQALRSDSVSLESDRNIHKKVDEFALSTWFDQKIENLDATVLGYNSGTTI
jgi:hypothetical protein